MITDDQGNNQLAVAHDDHVGKVFVAIGRMRMCLVCEQLFTRRAASGHAKLACWDSARCESEKRGKQR